jgi:CHASE3 domain sensor protein
MISAAELRKLQQSFLLTKEDEFITRFKKATDLYESILIQESQIAIMAAQKMVTNYMFLNYIPLTQSIEGFYYSTLLYGIWKDENLFQKFNIVSPFERANKELDRFGYRLENVSDPNKSNRLYLKLTWF